MRITRRQLKKLVQEASVQQNTPEQKLLDLVKTGDVNQADSLALALDIDLFPVLATDYQAVKALLGDLINSSDLENYMYMVADNSLYDRGFFNAMMYALPQFPSLTFGMSIRDIEDLINNNPEKFEIYLDAEMGLQMTYSSVLVSGGSMLEVARDWLIGIGFLKLERMYNVATNSGQEFSIADALSSLRLKK